MFGKTREMQASQSDSFQLSSLIPSTASTFSRRSIVNNRNVEDFCYCDARSWSSVRRSLDAPSFARLPNKEEKEIPIKRLASGKIGESCKKSEMGKKEAQGMLPWVNVFCERGIGINFHEGALLPSSPSMTKGNSLICPSRI